VWHRAGHLICPIPGIHVTVPVQRAASSPKPNRHLICFYWPPSESVQGGPLLAQCGAGSERLFMEWIPIGLLVFKLVVFGTGMFFAIKWHYDKEKKNKNKDQDKK
jgi:hypothetical protein